MAESAAMDMDHGPGGAFAQGGPPEPAPARAELTAEAARPARAASGEDGGGSPPAEGNSAAEPTEARPDVTPQRGPLLIYQARLHLAVHEVREKIDQVIAITDELGGVLSSQNDTTVVIRVPATRFRQALGRLEEVGDVLHRAITAQDVSDQYRDLGIRLRNAQQMRDRLAQLLERAQNVAESLAIERELQRLTETIELLRGQLRSLADRVAFSTITVNFQPLREDQEVPQERFQLPFPWLHELGLARLMELRR
jgi:hypothetical protein